MKRNFFWLIAAFIGSGTLVSCGDSNSATQRPNPAAAAVPVNTYKVKIEAVTGTDTYPGTVVPLKEVELRPQVTGYITDIYVQDGQQVSEGQKLYEIDRSKYQASYNQAQANLQSSRANLQKVKQDVERYERLSQQDAIARQRVDYARADLQTAQSQVAAAEAQLQSASTDLRYAVITAPFSGTIGISKVRVGAQVSPGQPLLNTISSNNPMAVDFVINEREIPRFNRLRQGAQPDSLFTIRLSDGSIYPYPGKIAALDRAVGRQSGTLTVRLNFPNPERQLIAGMTVNVNVLNQDIGKQVVIPYKAVTEQMGEYYAYVVQADSVVQRQLDLGTRIRELVVVRDGLKEGESIVVDGIQRLRQGAKVQVGAPQTANQQPVSK
jgi:membrane fusion protein (multidrug efflux system)